MEYIQKRKLSTKTNCRVIVQKRGYRFYRKSFADLTTAKKWAKTMEAKLDRRDSSDYSHINQYL